MDKQEEKAFLDLAEKVSLMAVYALRQAIIDDDDRLTQWGFITPPPMQPIADWPIVETCPTMFLFWSDKPEAVVADLPGWLDIAYAVPGMDDLVEWIRSSDWNDVRSALFVLCNRAIIERK